MGYKNRAYVIDNNLILSKNQALPAASGNVDSTNVVKYGGNSLGYAKIVVKAHDTITIANEKALTIKASYGATSTPTDTLSKVLYTATAGSGGITFVFIHRSIKTRIETPFHCYISVRSSHRFYT